MVVIFMDGNMLPLIDATLRGNQTKDPNIYYCHLGYHVVYLYIAALFCCPYAFRLIFLFLNILGKPKQDEGVIISFSISI